LKSRKLAKFGAPFWRNFNGKAELYYIVEVDKRVNALVVAVPMEDPELSKVNNLSVQALKTLLSEENISFQDCEEKEDLVKRYLFVQSSQLKVQETTLFTVSGDVLYFVVSPDASKIAYTTHDHSLCILTTFYLTAKLPFAYYS
jgi:hypothetical protein